MMKRPGFTLAELLIALAILGVIATFTIPKVLQSQQDEKFKSIAKEAAGTISAAYNRYKLSNSADSSTTLGALTPYMNYVAVETSALTVDHTYSSTTLPDCAWANALCLKLHNGSLLFLDKGVSFGGTGTTSAVYFYLDPDGRETLPSTTQGPGKSEMFFLYFNGRLSTVSNILPNTTTNWSTHNPEPNRENPWFDWN